MIKWLSAYKITLHFSVFLDFPKSYTLQPTTQTFVYWCILTARVDGRETKKVNPFDGLPRLGEDKQSKRR